MSSPITRKFSAAPLHTSPKSAPTSPLMFSRRPPKSANEVKDRVNLGGFERERANDFNELVNDIASRTMKQWENIQETHYVNVPWVSDMQEIPGQEGNDALTVMMGSRLPNGGVSFIAYDGPGIPSLPELNIEPSANSPTGVEVKLNGQVLTAQSSLQDIQLASQLAMTLHNYPDTALTE